MEARAHGEAPDRNLALELVRVTEAAAMAAARKMGFGDKEAVDQAAVDAMRHVLGSVSMTGVVVIGEGEKDNAPMLYNGEEIGDGTLPEVDIAVDPVDGTTLTAKSMPNAISVVALSDRGTMFDPGPCVYMEKLVVGPEAADAVDFEAPLALNLRLVAKAKGAQVGDLTVCILDRPRHEDLIGQIRQAGSRVKLITDGDVAGAIMAAREGTGVDMLVGIGGTPEAVIAACALKCLDGAMFGRLWPRNDDRAPGRPGRRLRPRQGPRHRRPGPRRQRLLRRHRRHRRRAPARRPLRPPRRPHPVPVDALQVRHLPPDRRPPPALQAEPLRLDRLRIGTEGTVWVARPCPGGSARPPRSGPAACCRPP